MIFKIYMVVKIELVYEGLIVYVLDVFCFVIVVFNFLSEDQNVSFNYILDVKVFYQMI